MNWWSIRKTGIITFVLLLGLICSHQTYGDNSPSQLKIELEIWKFRPESRPKYIVTLINTGKKELTVFTKSNENITTYKDTDTGLIELEFGLSMTTTRKDGVILIPSLTSLHPATLYKNEAVFLDISETDSRFKELPKEGKIMISYCVTKEWGERFNIWHGNISTQVFDIKNGEILEPKKER